MLLNLTCFKFSLLVLKDIKVRSVPDVDSNHQEIINLKERGIYIVYTTTPLSEAPFYYPTC